MSTSLTLTAPQQTLLDGAAGEGTALAMRVITALARALGASGLVEIESAHVDGCLFHGQVGIDFVERLGMGGARVRVPTTLNVGSLDLLHPGLVRAEARVRRAARRLMDGYVALGATPTWTCAPYQEASRPAFGAHIAWAESNAIAFANSVLGARTDRYGDFVDICAAVTGCAPLAGLHVDANRYATLHFDCSALPPQMFAADIAWAVLGHAVGRRAGSRVPALTGLPSDVSEDRLKAFGAAAATGGGVALFHAVGITPEAPDLATACGARTPPPPVQLTQEDLRAAYAELSSGREDRLDAVSLGTPHFSAREFEELAHELEDGRPFAADLDFWISTSRSALAAAEASGTAKVCRSAGAKILVDTCTYITPVLAPNVEVVMTNSAKWAWYAPTNIGVDVVFGSLVECVASARAGRVVRSDAWWSA